MIERFTIADVFGERDWALIARRVELPPGAISGRFHVQLNGCDRVSAAEFSQFSIVFDPNLA